METTAVVRKFNDVRLHLISSGEGDYLVPGEEIGKALGYSEPRKQIGKLFERNKEILDTPKCSGVVSVTTPGGVQEVRCYTGRGVRALLMYSRQPKAREFQEWVLDLLDELEKEWTRSVLSENTRLKEALGNDRFGLEDQRWSAESRAERAEASAKAYKRSLDLALEACGGHYPDSYAWAQINRIKEATLMDIKSIAWTPGGRVLRLSFKI